MFIWLHAIEKKSNFSLTTVVLFSGCTMSESDIDKWAAKAVHKWQQGHLGPEDKLSLTTSHILALRRHFDNHNVNLSLTELGTLVIGLEIKPTTALPKPIGQKASKLYHTSTWEMPMGRVRSVHDTSPCGQSSSQVTQSNSAVTQGLCLNYSPPSAYHALIHYRILP